jgi:hypothetical protein
MPRGFDKVKEASERLSRNSGGSGSGVFYLKLPDDQDSAIIRFLEQGDEVYSYWYHDFSHADKKNGWRNRFPCLDLNDEGTPCPGCEQELPRRFQGLINVIWRDAPVLKKDDEGNFVRNKKTNEIEVDGNADQVAVWRGGIELFKLLAKKDAAYKGLGTRDVEVVRDGTGLDTTYSVEPADLDAGASELSDADQELAKDKYDLDEVANYKTYDEAEEIIKEFNDENGSSSEDVGAFLEDNPFNQNKD